MYVAVKGGEKAIDAAHALQESRRRGDTDLPELSVAQIEQQLNLAVDRVMTEGGSADRELAALALKQASGDNVEAIFLLRAYRTTLAKLAVSEPLDTTYAYPVKVNGRYVMDPSPIPKFDNPKMDMMPALQLFGAGREKRIYAVPPFTRVESLDFDDHPFTVQQWDEPCAICGSTHSYLDEVVLDDAGNRMFVCSDTDYCRQQSEAKNQ